MFCICMSFLYKIGHLSIVFSDTVKMTFLWTDTGLTLNWTELKPVQCQCQFRVEKLVSGKEDTAHCTASANLHLYLCGLIVKPFCSCVRWACGGQAAWRAGSRSRKHDTWRFNFTDLIAIAIAKSLWSLVLHKTGKNPRLETQDQDQDSDPRLGTKTKTKPRLFYFIKFFTKKYFFFNKLFKNFFRNE